MTKICHDFLSEDAKHPKHKTVTIYQKNITQGRKRRREIRWKTFFSVFWGTKKVHDCSIDARLHFTDSAVWNSDSLMRHYFDRIWHKIWPHTASRLFQSMMKIWLKKKNLTKKKQLLFCSLLFPYCLIYLKIFLIFLKPYVPFLSSFTTLAIQVSSETLTIYWNAPFTATLIIRI